MPNMYLQYVKSPIFESYSFLLNLKHLYIMCLLLILSFSHILDKLLFCMTGKENQTSGCGETEGVTVIFRTECTSRRTNRLHNPDG